MAERCAGCLARRHCDERIINGVCLPDVLHEARMVADSYLHRQGKRSTGGAQALAALVAWEREGQYLAGHGIAAWVREAPAEERARFVREWDEDLAAFAALLARVV